MRLARSRSAPLALLLLAASCTAAPPPPPPAAPPPVPAPTVTVAPAPSAPAPVATAAPTASAAVEAPPEEEPLPAGFVHIAREGETRCGGFRVQVEREPGKGYERFVRVLGPDGKRVYEAHGRRYKVEPKGVDFVMDLGGEFCGDLTGDGIPEIVLTEATMGAHCCYTHYAVSLTTPPKRLLMWEKGDAGTPVLPAKYRPGPVWQIQGRVVMWPPFEPEKGDPALSYAGAPLVPVVFSLVGGEYKMTSLSFPEAYRKDRDELRAACVKAPDDCYSDLIEWIDSLVIGDWDAYKQNIKDPDLRASLDRVAPRMKKALRSLGSERSPAPTTPKP